MKKWTFRISPRRAAFGGTICLILGVVTTVGVAWGFALLPIWRGAPSITDTPRIRALERAIEMEHSPLYVSGGTYGLGVGQTAYVLIASTEDAQGGPVPLMTLFLVETGFPFSCLEALDVRIDNPQVVRPLNLPSGAFVRIGDHASFQPPLPHLLPLRPRPQGFAVNTLIYAVIWFALIQDAGRIQRFIRTRRGRCPRCGYDLRGEFDQGCSECGWGREMIDQECAR